MTALQLTLLGVALSATFGLLIFRAKRRYADRERIAQAKEHRIADVAERYRDLARRAESSNLIGMLRAGVLRLDSNEEVEEVLRRIDAEGLGPAIPRVFQEDLQGADLIAFFRLLQDHPQEARSAAGVRRLIPLAKSSPGA